MRVAWRRPWRRTRSSSRAATSPAALAGGCAQDDVDAVGLGAALEAGGDVHRVADHRVVEALGGAEIADEAAAGVDADAEAQGLEGISALGGVLGGQLGVEQGQAAAHLEGRLAGAGGVALVGQGRVPERHDGVADILVDGACWPWTASVITVK